MNLLHTITAQKLPADIFARLIEAIPQHVPQAATTYTGGMFSSVFPYIATLFITLVVAGESHNKP